jgi:hypothetical protein
MKFDAEGIRSLRELGDTNKFRDIIGLDDRVWQYLIDLAEKASKETGGT